MSFDWYAFNPNEFRRDTYHLGAAADGIYRRLIDEYMVTRKPLPDHDLALAGIARVTAQEWGEHREVVRAFFKSRDGKLFHKRCDRELHAQSMLAAKRSRQAKEAATVRWAKGKTNQRDGCSEHNSSNADAMLKDATLHNTSISLTSIEVGETDFSSEKKKPNEVGRGELAAIFQKRGLRKMGERNG